MKHDPKNPAWKDRDRFILSKGHAALIQYAALVEAGYFPRSEIDSVKCLGAMLQGHPDMKTTPGIEGNTGSLGQGLSMACGMAAGLRLDKKDNKVYCIIGDGEIAEGQIWEAAMSASVFKLDNLIVFLDKNNLQATGMITDRILSLKNGKPLDGMLPKSTDIMSKKLLKLLMRSIKCLVNLK
jgi:transketolase